MRYLAARLAEPSTILSLIVAAVHFGLIPPGPIADYTVYAAVLVLAGTPDGFKTPNATKAP